MLAEGSAFKLMDALLEVGSDGATREHLLRKASISVRTFYKQSKELIKSGLITERGNRYYLPLDSEYAFRFKLWRDLDKLYDREERARNAVLTVLNDSLASIGDKIMCLWLVGSAARGEMKTNSDLDFLVVTRAETEYEPKVGHFKIQWVTQRRREFLEKLSDGDEFVISALREGLLLHDNGVAQSLYRTPIGKPSASFFKDKENVIESLQRRFFDHLEFDEIEEANDTLSSIAEASLRMMLQHLGERPQGKRNLNKLSTLYFGDRIAEEFSDAISIDPSFLLERGELIDTHRQISDYCNRFLARTEHLSFIAKGLLKGHPHEFERALPLIFQELFGEATVKVRPNEILLTYAGKTVVIQWKTIAGTVNPEHLRPLHDSLSKWWNKGEDASGLFVVNSLRDVPLSERTSEDVDRMQKDAHELNVSLITSSQLLRIFHSFYLIGLRSDYSFDSLLVETVNRFYLKGLIMRELEKLPVLFPEESHRESFSKAAITDLTIESLSIDKESADENCIFFQFVCTFSLKLELSIAKHPWADNEDEEGRPEVIIETVEDSFYREGQAALLDPATSNSKIKLIYFHPDPIEYSRETLYELIGY